MSNNKTFSIKLDEKIHKRLRDDIDNKVTRNVLNKVAQEYNCMMKSTDLFFKELELREVDKKIAMYENSIKELTEYRVKLEEEYKELEEIHVKESKSLDDCWSKICEYGLTNEKKFDYTDLNMILQENLMSDDDLIVFCTAKLKERIHGLEEVKKTSKSNDIDIELKKCNYLIKQFQRLEEVKFINGGEL